MNRTPVILLEGCADFVTSRLLLSARSQYWVEGSILAIGCCCGGSYYSIALCQPSARAEEAAWENLNRIVCIQFRVSCAATFALVTGSRRGRVRTTTASHQQTTTVPRNSCATVSYHQYASFYYLVPAAAREEADRKKILSQYAWRYVYIFSCPTQMPHFSEAFTM